MVYSADGQQYAVTYPYHYQGNRKLVGFWPMTFMQFDWPLFVSIRWICTRRQPHDSAGASSWRHRWCCFGDVGRRCDGIGPRLSIFRILMCLREPSPTPPDLQHGTLFPCCFNFAFTPRNRRSDNVAGGTFACFSVFVFVPKLIMHQTSVCFANLICNLQRCTLKYWRLASR